VIGAKGKQRAKGTESTQADCAIELVVPVRPMIGWTRVEQIRVVVYLYMVDERLGRQKVSLLKSTREQDAI
jgi:hypothetical protein